MRRTPGTRHWAGMAVAVLAIGCGGGSMSDVGTDPGRDGADAEIAPPDDVPTQDGTGDRVDAADGANEIDDVVDETGDAANEAGDVADADAPAGDVPAPDVPKVPRDIPFAPPPFANPLVDGPYAQETNHTINEVEPGIGPLIAVLLPPANLVAPPVGAMAPASAMATYEVPTQVTPRGLVTHGGDGSLHVLTIPEGDPDLVGAAFVPDGILLAGSQRLYTRYGDSLVAHELPSPPADLGNIVGVDPGVARAFLRTGGNSVGVVSSTDPTYWSLTFHWALWPNVTAVTETADTTFAATWLGAVSGSLAGVVAVQSALFPYGMPTGIDPILPPSVSLSRTGPVRALVAGVTLATSLDLVAMGDSGLQGLSFQDGVFADVDVPLFANDRVPLDRPVAATPTADGGFLVATKGGAYRLRDIGLGAEWHVYARQRWLPDEDVRGVATDATTPGAPLYFATSGGLGSVTTQSMTLEGKMAGFVDRIVTRHDRDGAVADSHLLTPGDLSTNVPYDSDNDGGWTCYWVLSECFRWKVTGDLAAKAHFDKSLTACCRCGR